MPKNQSGFRKGKSSIDDFAYLHANRRIVIKKDVIVVFLDLYDTFLNVLSDILLSKLASVGLPAEIIKLFEFLTFERCIHTSIIEGGTDRA